MHFNGIFYALSAAFFFGLIPTLTKISYSSGASPEIAIISRYFLASLIIIIPLLKIIKNFNNIKKYLISLLILSFGSFCLTCGLLISVIFIPVSLVALIFYTYPLFVLIYAFVLGKKLNILQISGFMLAFIGLGIALGPNFESLNIFGILLAFLAATGAATVLIVNEHLADHFHAITLNAFVNFSCLITFSAIILLNFDVNTNLEINGWVFIVFASLCYCIAFYVQLIAVKNMGSARTSLILYFEPIVAIVSAIILLKESLSLTQIIGTIIVITSIILTTKQLQIKKN